MVFVEGKVCGKCGEWKPLEEYNKRKRGKYGRQSECRECQKEYKKQWRCDNKERIKEHRKQWVQNNKEHIEEYQKQWRENNPGYHNSEQQKQYREVNKEKKKEYDKQWRINNAEHIREYHKQYYQDNAELIKQYKIDNAEHIKEYGKRYRDEHKESAKKYMKQWYDGIKENNLQYISNIVEQINPMMKNLPVYGYIYKFENIKTGHQYLGQSTLPLKERYGSNAIKSWIKERLDKSNQKFTEELIEEDIVVTEVLDVAFCQYHLDKLEAYWINYYDSYNNGYNNNAGYHNTDDGLEEFNKILEKNGLEFINGKLKKIV